MNEVMHYNLVNEAMNLKASETPQVGTVATMFCGSDRWPMVCTEVISKKRVRVAHMSSEDYELCEKDEKLSVLPEDRLFSDTYFGEFPGMVTCKVEGGKVFRPLRAKGKVYTLRKNHRWIVEGDDLWSTGAIHFGHAEEYRDPSF